MDRQKSLKKESNSPNATTLSPGAKRQLSPDRNGGSPLKLQQTSFDELSPFIPNHLPPEELGEGHANYLRAKQELDDTIKDLDVKLNRVLAKQEYEYLKGYNVYVRQKERELKTTIAQLSERFNNQGTKEKKILALQQGIKAIRDEQIVMDRENVGLREKIKEQKKVIGEVSQEKEFFEKKTKEVKKKNKLLKLAIIKLQSEVESLKKQEKVKVQQDYENEKQNFFLTELSALKKNSPRTLETEEETAPKFDTIGKDTSKHTMSLLLDPLNTSTLTTHRDKPLA